MEDASRRRAGGRRGGNLSGSSPRPSLPRGLSSAANARDGSAIRIKSRSSASRAPRASAWAALRHAGSFDTVARRAGCGRGGDRRRRALLCQGARRGRRRGCGRVRGGGHRARRAADEAAAAAGPKLRRECALVLRLEDGAHGRRRRRSGLPRAHRGRRAMGGGRLQDRRRHRGAAGRISRASAALPARDKPEHGRPARGVLMCV